MIRAKVHVRPIPIALLITTANSFDCSIFVESQQSKLNAKNYNELMSGLRATQNPIFFYFDGKDEKEAEARIERIFTP